jgi:hypothetical protein
MAIEPLRYEPVEGTPHRRLISERRLVFDDRVNGRMHRCVRESHASAPVIVRNEPGPLVLIEGKPFL